MGHSSQFSWRSTYSTNECGKVAYGSRKAARLGAKRTPKARHEPPRRAYRCPHCKWWHWGHLPNAVRHGALTIGEAYGTRQVEMAPNQRPVDMTKGVFTPREVADRFRVTVSTVYDWVRNYQKDKPGAAQLPGFRTADGQWRVSVRSAMEILGGGEHDDGPITEQVSD